MTMLERIQLFINVYVMGGTLLMVYNALYRNDSIWIENVIISTPVMSLIGLFVRICITASRNKKENDMRERIRLLETNIHTLEMYKQALLAKKQE